LVNTLIRLASDAWDEFRWFVLRWIYQIGHSVMRPSMRYVGGDFWLHCLKCGGTITPQMIPSHMRRHRDEDDT
jgi:hypothetical protein